MGTTKKINMSKQKLKDYTFTFESTDTPDNVFEQLLDVRNWWTGLYQEEIKGNTGKLKEEFTFTAGGGAHYSKQKLIKAISGKKIVWLVTDSNLNFLDKPGEWIGTKICFEISKIKNKTWVTFTHKGLQPGIECYGGCSNAWSKYLQKI